MSPDLSPSEVTHYQSLTGFLTHMVDLCRVDVCLEVSIISSRLSLPREGHLDHTYHMFSYLNNHRNIEIVFDPSDPIAQKSTFKR